MTHEALVRDNHGIEHIQAVSEIIINILGHNNGYFECKSSYKYVLNSQWFRKYICFTVTYKTPQIRLIAFINYLNYETHAYVLAIVRR